ncbi:hypothetical protein [Frigoribacterium faeni]|uniref:Uncharacterized protein n=1 Tax=Frigoribacterium faeni TaxID=145483 RepID=A0A7W3PIX8_9MICO|nr:hypothetical protein [Frigoribacterium faeni]MBA8813149.1 hypothetical protein [Frigoribacterium faeni]BFF14340.1 hypothetical protein GCM10025699_56430 [Microbacterium flavescens]GEK83453.1 hypothetical protein FFA01_17620 [Frigoribacterium faeni]
MATWGYRVYTFKLVGGQDELSQEIEEHRERLHEVLTLVGQRTRVGKPYRGTTEAEVGDEEALQELPEDEYENTQPTLTVRGSAFDKDLSAIHANIALGEQGLHDYAINPAEGSDRVDVKSRSAETPRRTDFYFASAGFEGFLVTEVVGMKDPIPLLAKWIRHVSMRQRKQKLDAITSLYQTPDPEGTRVSKTKAHAAVPKTLSIRVERVADPELLKQILDDIQSMDTEYTELDEDNNETDKRLIVKVREKKVQRSIVDLLAGTGDGDSIIRQTLEELDMDAEGLRAAKIEPNKVKAHVRGNDGTTTLAPGKISDLFNYSFKAAGRPGDSPYYTTTLSKIDQLKKPSQIPLVTPEGSEMIEWVQREEEGWQVQETPNNE